MPVLHWIMFSNSCGQTWRQSRCKGPNIKLWAGAGAAGGRRVCTGFLLLRFVFRAGYNFHTSAPSFKCKNEIHQQHWETSLQESQTQSDTWLNLNLVWCWMWSEILQMGYIRVWHSWKFQHKHISKYIKNVHIQLLEYPILPSQKIRPSVTQNASQKSRVPAYRWYSEPK